MRLIDNYLSAVADYLPGGNREDIKAELKSSLYEQLEEQSAELQRDLTEEDQVEFLKKIGHPLKVAGEYAPQRFMIGPTLFPYYLQSLKVVALAVCVFQILLSIIVAVSSEQWGITSDSTVSRIVSSMLVMFAFLTIGFALMERSGQSVEWVAKWNPLSLRNRDNYLAVDRGDLITSIITDFVLLLWWNGALVLPAQVSWVEGSIALMRSPAWDVVFWPVNVLLVVSFVLSSAMLMKGFWGGRTVSLWILIEMASAAVLIYLIRTPELVGLDTSGDHDFVRIRDGITVGVRIALWAFFAMVLWDLVTFGKKAIRLARGWKT